jgi:hypothetical protein
MLLDYLWRAGKMLRILLDKAPFVQDGEYMDLPLLRYGSAASEIERKRKNER